MSDKIAGFGSEIARILIRQIRNSKGPSLAVAQDLSSHRRYTNHIYTKAGFFADDSRI